MNEEDAIKKRIRWLMNRNKQINISLKTTTPEGQKTALNDERLRNNDQLRQERSKRFKLEHEQSDTEFIKECCKYLQRLGICKSRHDFCVGFLGKSQHYLAVILCENRHPSVNILHDLVQNLVQIQTVYEEYEHKAPVCHYLAQLIDKGNRIITQRLLAYI